MVVLGDDGQTVLNRCRGDHGVRDASRPIEKIVAVMRTVGAKPPGICLGALIVLLRRAP